MTALSGEPANYTVCEWYMLASCRATAAGDGTWADLGLTLDGQVGVVDLRVLPALAGVGGCIEL